MLFSKNHRPILILILIIFFITPCTGLAGPKSDDEIKQEIAQKIEYGNSYIADIALVMTEKYPGEYTINQVGEIFSNLTKGEWPYRQDPPDVENIRYANQTLKLGLIANFAGIGDCDDFAILMASLIESIGGTARVNFDYTNTGGHAYTEVYLGRKGDQNTTKLIDWLLTEYKDVPGIDNSTHEIWLNLDYYSRDSFGKLHPGCPYFEGNQKVIKNISYIRDPANKRAPKVLPVIDSMDSPAGWKESASYGSSVAVASKPGMKGNASEISFDLKEKGEARISKNITAKDLMGVNGLSFYSLGTGAPNTIQLILAYDDGTAFGVSWNKATAKGDWTLYNALYKDFLCLDFNKCGENGVDLNKVKKIEFMISNNPDKGDVAGSGTVLIDNIQGIMAEATGSPVAEADKRRKIADARRLAVQSELIQGNPEKIIQSIQLAVESLRQYDTLEGNLALQRRLASFPSCIADLWHNNSVNIVTFSSDGTKLATASNDTAYLWDVKTGKELHRLKHDNRVVQVAFSPDDSKLATASWDCTARIWDVQTGEDLHRLQHGGAVSSLSFSEDFSHIFPRSFLLATGSFDNTSRIWDVQTGRELLKLEHEGPVSSVALSSVISDWREARLATCCGNIVHLWNLTTGQDLKKLEHDDNVRVVAFSQGSSKLATASDDIAWIWETESGAELHKLEHNLPVNSVAFNLDGSKLATCSDDKTARIWDVETGREIMRLEHDGRVNSVAFSIDGTKLATASDDQTARIWDVWTGHELQKIIHYSEVTALAFSLDGTKLATSGWFDFAYIWDLSACQKMYTVEYYGEAFDVAFSPEGTKIATINQDYVPYTARIWDAQTGQELHTLEHKSPYAKGPFLWHVAFSPDGTRLVILSENNTSCIWDVQTGQELNISKIDRNDIWLNFSPDWSKLATCMYDKIVRVWDVQTGQELKRLKLDSKVSYATFGPDGTQLVTLSEDNTVCIWDVQTGQELHKLKYDSTVHSVAFSPDGSKLVVSCYDGTNRIWDVQTGQERRLENDVFMRISRFSPDGTKLAAGSVDQTVCIWDVQTGKELYRLQHDYGGTHSLVFSPDGTKLATCSDDKTARIWDVQTGQELERLEHDGRVNSVAFSPDGTKLATASGTITLYPWNQPITASRSTVRIYSLLSQDLICQACSRLKCNLTSQEWRDQYCRGCQDSA